VGVSAQGSASVTSGSTVLVQSDFALSSTVPVGEAYCEAVEEEDSANVRRAWPAVAAQTISEELDITDFDLADEPTFSVHVSVSADDTAQLMLPSPRARAVYPPQVYFEETGMGAQQSWGLFMIIVGGILVCPAVTIMMAALGSS